jgi:glutamate synthase domain-containing protein 2
MWPKSSRPVRGTAPQHTTEQAADDTSARQVEIATGVDGVSPSRHSAFATPIEMMEFIATLRRLSGGKPTGVSGAFVASRLPDRETLYAVAGAAVSEEQHF